MGFLTSHIQVTRLLEASLQSVDASVALPYWEYTKDVEVIIAEHNGNFQKVRKKSRGVIYGLEPQASEHTRHTGVIIIIEAHVDVIE